MQLSLEDYKQSGILQKIVQCFPDWTVGLTVINSLDNKQIELNQWVAKIQLLKIIKRAAISARLFGEAYIVIYNSTEDLSEPPNIGNVELLLLKEKGEILPVKDEELGVILHYELQNQDKTELHPDRVIEFTGVWYSPAMGGENGSVLEPVENAYRLHDKSNKNLSNIIERFLTFVQKVGNLKSYLASEFPGVLNYTEKLYEALSQLVRTIGKGVLLMDKANGELEALSPNVGGLSELSSRILENLVANQPTPYSLLMGSGNYALSSKVEYNFFKIRLMTYFNEEIQQPIYRILTAQGFQVEVLIDFMDTDLNLS